MNSCIITIIKNEHLYLDEWIKYHLNMGVSHIYIFEDIDSYSHQNITNKYDKVILNSINIVLNPRQQEEAKQLKKTKKYSAHYLYLKNILIYMHTNYSDIYDWLIPIDVDEFIELNSHLTLNDTLSLYQNYDALLLRWKCFGANGRINKPDYNLVSTPEAFTTEVKNIAGEKPSCQCKTCYNISKYKPEFFGTPHSPKDTCNYCNTDFIKSDTIPIFTNIYLKHYITKSWEEYIWKLQMRGFMWGGRRNFDFFFNLNPDLLPQKGALMEELNTTTLVVMPYSGKRAQGKEIELVLTGWKKYCHFKYHFIVIGDFDNVNIDDFDWVEFINCPRIQYVPGQYNPHLDIIHKFSVVADIYQHQYPGFIYITDDEYAIKPFSLREIKQTYCHALSFQGEKDKPTCSWNHDKWKTRQLLDAEKLPHINYTTHFPAYFEFDKLKLICDKYNLYNESYVFDDVYFNSFAHEEPIFDDKIRLGIWNQDIFNNDFQKALEDPNIKFMCNSTDGWSKELEQKLEEYLRKE